jgi:hypothetical protein
MQRHGGVIHERQEGHHAEKIWCVVFLAFRYSA